MESFHNGIATHFQATVLPASSQSFHSVDADAWCKQAPRDGELWMLSVKGSDSSPSSSSMSLNERALGVL